MTLSEMWKYDKFGTILMFWCAGWFAYEVAAGYYFFAAFFLFFLFLYYFLSRRRVKAEKAKEEAYEEFYAEIERRQKQAKEVFWHVYPPEENKDKDKES